MARGRANVSDGPSSRPQMPDAQRFGYEVEREKAQIRWEMAGLAMEPIRLHFAVEAEYLRRHKDDPTYREISERRHRAERAETPTHGVQFTVAELEFLAAHFDGANDPTAADILAKVRRLLGG